MIRILSPLFALLLAAQVAFAQDKPEKPAEQPVDPQQLAAQFEKTLKYEQGDIVLPNKVAALKVPEQFRYLNPEDTRKVLEELWGNPDGKNTLGMLVPSGQNLASNQSWAVVITYEEDGHVSDEDADKIDYDDMLKQMQEGIRAANEERKKAGYGTLELVGWAAKPRYDKATKKLYWAKRLQFNQDKEHTLNYNVRVLGRKGVLVLNAVSGIDQLDKIERDMQQVIAFTNFTDGNRYQDFDSSVDKVAAYGLGALIAGGVAAKTGLLAKLLVMLVAFKKAIILGALAIGAAVVKLFRGKKSSDQA